MADVDGFNRYVTSNQVSNATIHALHAQGIATSSGPAKRSKADAVVEQAVHVSPVAGSSPYSRFQWARQNSGLDLAPFSSRPPLDPSSEMKSRFGDPQVVTLERKVLGARLLNMTFVSTLELRDWRPQDEAYVDARASLKQRAATTAAAAAAASVAPAGRMPRGLRYRDNVVLDVDVPPGARGQFGTTSGDEYIPYAALGFKPEASLGRFAWPRTSSQVPMGDKPSSPLRPRPQAAATFGNDPFQMAYSRRVVHVGDSTTFASLANTGSPRRGPSTHHAGNAYEASLGASLTSTGDAGAGAEARYPAVAAGSYHYEPEDNLRAPQRASLLVPSRPRANPQMAAPGEVPFYGRGRPWDKFGASSDIFHRNGPGAMAAAAAAAAGGTTHGSHFTDPRMAHRQSPPRRCPGTRTNSTVPING